MQEEYGNRAAPEILRLYASAVKKSTKPSKDLTTSTKSTSTLRATKNLPSVGSARSRPSTTSAQLSQNTGIGIRSSKQTVNPRGVNMTSTSFSRTSHVHPMNDVKRTQQQTQSQTAPVKRAPAVSARISRGSVKPVLVPNIVRVTKHPTKENCNVSGGNLKARSSSNLTNDSTTIVRNTSGLRPPTAVTRISTGIPRLSRPNSPAK
ncbi:hypothetical protein DICVIV_11279 [Dictyocaulus viviparus]|uniref:Uncharacterized protein n=1 Tax=Dictyocaulus viviparus TaxID=29172 RepID=A0A0D8XG73_DICVI|nr:hypothetical protein DICVIV_11279 [Dictyocaulus viviparus]